MVRRVSLISLVLIAVASLAAPSASGQGPTLNNNSTTPMPGQGHNYLKMFNETVNPANGSLSIRIGVPAPPGRGLTLPFSFNYDSNGVE